MSTALWIGLMAVLWAAVAYGAHRDTKSEGISAYDMAAAKATCEVFTALSGIAMAARWAPVGTENDPTNLNQHWPGNVWRVYKGSGIV